MTNLSNYGSQPKRGKVGRSIDDFLGKKHTDEEVKKEFEVIKGFVEEIFKINDIQIFHENFIGLFSEGYKAVQKNLYDKEYNKFPLMKYTSVLKMPVECYIKQYNNRAEFWVDYVKMKSGTKVEVKNMNDVYKGMMLALGIEVAMVEKYL